MVRVSLAQASDSAGMAPKLGDQHAVNTTCCVMPRLSLGLYSGQTPRERAHHAQRLHSTELAQHLHGTSREIHKMDFDSDSVGGYAVPLDPMDLLQCDSCQ